MAISLETVIGSTGPLEERNVVLMSPSNISTKGVVVTFNFAEKAPTYYIVTEALPDMGQRLIDAYAKDALELATVYTMEKQEANDASRQKSEKWKRDWEKQHSVWLILKALEREGFEVRALLSQYEAQGFLYDARKPMVVKLARRKGVEGEILQGVEAIANNQNVSEDVWKALKEKLGVELPENLEKPNLAIEEIPDLRGELGAIVMTAYNGASLAEGLSRGVWEELGVNVEEIYGKIKADIKGISPGYMLARVTGISQSAGDIKVVEPSNGKESLVARVPGELRDFFRRPAELDGDACALSVALYHVAIRYFVKDSEVRAIIEDERGKYFAYILMETLLGGRTAFVDSLEVSVSIGNDSSENISQYRRISEKVRDDIAAGMLDRDEFYESLGIKAVKTQALVETICSLADFVEELHLLRTFAMLERKDLGFLDDLQRKGRQGTQQYRKIRADLGVNRANKAALVNRLGAFVNGYKEWNLKVERESAAKAMARYDFAAPAGVAAAAQN